MFKCGVCGKRIRPDSKNLSKCKRCLAVCSCGAYKDFRAEKCRSCASTELVKAQWQNPEVRNKMRAAMIEAGPKRWIRFEDLTWDSFNKEQDGRWATLYRADNSGKRKHIRRYVWVWVKSHGPVPEGYIVHHKDFNKEHDDLDNLELMTQSEHARLHGKIKNNLLKPN